MIDMNDYLNARQIRRVTTRAIKKHPKDVKLLKLLREYAKYFPMAVITKRQIRDPKAVRKYMFSPDLGFDSPLKMKVDRHSSKKSPTKHCES